MVGNFEIQINVARGAVPPIETVTDIGIGALADVEGSLTIRAGEFVYDSALPPLPIVSEIFEFFYIFVCSNERCNTFTINNSPIFELRDHKDNIFFFFSESFGAEESEPFLVMDRYLFLASFFEFAERVFSLPIPPEVSRWLVCRPSSNIGLCLDEGRNLI